MSTMVPRDHSCDILVKEVAAFCPCTKNLPKAKVESVGLIPLAKGGSKQPGTDSVMCLLVITLMKIHKKRSKLSKKQYSRRKHHKAEWS